MNQVGVVTTSYNQHAFLSQAIQSVLAQTHGDFNMYVVNDYRGMQDSEKAEQELEIIIRDFSDPRIRLIHNETNLGIPGARNVAVRKHLEEGASSIFFLDHDDLWIDPEKLAKQLNILNNGIIGILGTQFQIVDRVNMLIGGSHNPLAHEDIRKAILLSCPILFSSMGVRREVFESVGLFDERYNGSDDWEFLIRATKRFVGGNIPDESTQYRYYSSNTTQTQWRRLMQEHIRLIRETGDLYNGYHRALLLAYLKWVMPPEWRENLKGLKKYILPGYNTYDINK